MPERRQPIMETGRPGIGIDSYGGQVIDPTKNVLDLVAAQEKLLLMLRETDLKHLNDMRDAETRRVNELAAQKMMFDLEMARSLRAGQDAASTLLATQLKEVKTDIQSELRSLNQFRWESGGKLSGAAGLWAGIIAIVGIAIALAVVLKH